MKKCSATPQDLYTSMQRGRSGQTCRSWAINRSSVLFPPSCLACVLHLPHAHTAFATSVWCVAPGLLLHVASSLCLGGVGGRSPRPLSQKSPRPTAGIVTTDAQRRTLPPGTGGRTDSATLRVAPCQVCRACVCPRMIFVECNCDPSNSRTSDAIPSLRSKCMEHTHHPLGACTLRFRIGCIDLEWVSGLSSSSVLESLGISAVSYVRPQAQAAPLASLVLPRELSAADSDPCLFLLAMAAHEGHTAALPTLSQIVCSRTPAEICVVVAVCPPSAPTAQLGGAISALTWKIVLEHCTKGSIIDDFFIHFEQFLAHCNEYTTSCPPTFDSFASNYKLLSVLHSGRPACNTLLFDLPDNLETVMHFLGTLNAFLCFRLQALLHIEHPLGVLLLTPKVVQGARIGSGDTLADCASLFDALSILHVSTDVVALRPHVRQRLPMWAARK